jgi:hypothetical protein
MAAVIRMTLALRFWYPLATACASPAGITTIALGLEVVGRAR